MRFILLIIYLLIVLLAFNQFDVYLLNLVAAFRGQLILISLLTAMLLFFNSKKIAATLIILSFCLAVVHFKPFSSAKEVHNSDIKITQLNLQYSNPNLAQLINSQLLVEQNDILLLFEFNDTQRHVLDELNTNYHLFGYAENEGAPFGIIVISKLPIVQRQIKRFDNPKLGYVKLSFLYDNIMLNGLFFHPPSPRTYNLWTQRNRVLSAISKEAENLKGNWLIAGDFNTVPWSRYFIAGKNNCFSRNGFYTTWPTKIQMNELLVLGIPIDHCFVSEKIDLANIKTSFVKGSDHKSLTYELILSK